MSIDTIPSLQRRRNRRRIRKIFRFLVLVLVLAAAAFFISQFFISKISKRDQTSSLISPFVVSGQKPQVKSKTLAEAVGRALEGTNGRYAVVIKNLKSGEAYFLNETQEFEAGSLYKLWVMGKAMENIQAGILKEDQILSDSIAGLNLIFGIDPEEAEQTSGTITLSVHDSINQMITISHNYAGLLLSKELKLSSVASYISEHGFLHSKVGVGEEAPVTTASDIASFFEKLYKGELTNEQYTQEMLDFLKRQQLNSKFPKYLPFGTVIAHKTGEIGWFSHDAGVVFTDKGDYIIVVLSESESPTGAEERIAAASKAVFEYFTNKN